MFPWLLIVFIAYVALRVIIGYRKGFAKMAVSLGATILSAILIFIFADTITGLIVDNTPLDESISERIEENLSDTVSTEEEMNEKIDGMTLPEGIKNKLKLKVKETQGSLADRIKTLGRNIAVKLIQLGVYVIGFIVIWILIQLLGRVLNLVAKLPLLREANKVLGVLLSLAEGWLVVDIVLIAITAFCNTGIGSILMAQVEGNGILTWLFEHNLLSKFLGM